MSDDAGPEKIEANKGVSKRKEKSGNPPVIIREMELEDLSEVFALGERLFTADLWPTLYRTWDEYELVQAFATDSETCLVAEVGGKVAGFALGTLLDKRRSAWTYGYLVWLGVDPTLGRQGIGKKLVNRLTEIFIEQGARMMLVDTEADNVGAVQFFHSHGFGNDTKHVYMSKNLTHHPEYLRRKKLAAATQVSKHSAGSLQSTAVKLAAGKVAGTAAESVESAALGEPTSENEAVIKKVATKKAKPKKSGVKSKGRAKNSVISIQKTEKTRGASRAGKKDETP